ALPIYDRVRRLRRKNAHRCLLSTGDAGLERALPDEAERDAEQRERLHQHEAEEQVGTGQAGRLRLARGGLDVRAEDETDTNGGTDGGEAVADRGDTTHDIGGGGEWSHEEVLSC